MDGKSLIQEITLPKSVVTLFDQMKEPYGIKNFESRYVYANHALLKVYGVNKVSDLVGNTEKEIKSKLVEPENTALEFIRQDRVVFNLDQPLNSLEIHPLAVDYPYLVNKVPFRDINNKCIGILAYVKRLDVYSTNNYVKGNMTGSLLLNKPDDFFTERECEVMFYRLQGMAPAAVALRLGLSETRFSHCMQGLYLKAGTANFDDFQAFCVSRFYHRYLPAKLRTNNKINLSVVK
ncbi:PAS domain-containing protein [Acerihabitans sp. TG2]|uniref:PAS domain-containing protein n=1 Tax=Acerihabitans sp. TG2 TaxID=3096008 RepID=UPI002B22E916|nr:PAS domain-containing protein [Acerihabitans sp. TG2]MEA9389092.1 PAS domain-containing protein [Acerihabitans sp. TG2]